MQHQANPSEDLTFATVVPSVTSTRHVAAAAFYHCLGKEIHCQRLSPWVNVVLSIGDKKFGEPEAGGVVWSDCYFDRLIAQVGVRIPPLCLLGIHIMGVCSSVLA